MLFTELQEVADQQEVYQQNLYFSIVYCDRFKNFHHRITKSFM